MNSESQRSLHILVVDDEQRIREVVQYALERDGYQVRCEQDAAGAIRALAERAVDLIVLDVMLPDQDGLALCRQIRAEHNTPILFLSARSDEIDRVVGLEVGGDDYLTKPFSTRELVARVRAVLRRAVPAAVESAPQSTLTHGAVSIDRERHEVRCGDVPVHLTPTELAVLCALLERPGVVWTRAMLMQRAHDLDTHVTERTIDTHIRRIRAKFRVHGLSPVTTVHGVGYKASDPG